MQDYEKYLIPLKEGINAFAERVKQLLGSSLLEICIFGSKVRGDFDRGRIIYNSLLPLGLK